MVTIIAQVALMNSKTPLPLNSIINTASTHLPLSGQDTTKATEATPTQIPTYHSYTSVQLCVTYTGYIPPVQYPVTIIPHISQTLVSWTSLLSSIVSDDSSKHSIVVVHTCSCRLWSGWSGNDSTTSRIDNSHIHNH